MLLVSHRPALLAGVDGVERREVFVREHADRDARHDLEELGKHDQLRVGRRDVLHARKALLDRLQHGPPQSENTARGVGGHGRRLHTLSKSS